MSGHPLDSILRNGHGMLLAYDHGFEQGVQDFDDLSVNPDWVLNIANQGHFTGFVCQKGIASKYYDKSAHQVPLIVKLNGKTPYHFGEDPISLQNCSVDEAIAYGAVGVAYTIYVGSKKEQQMISEFGRIEEEAHKKGLFVVGWMYADGEQIVNDVERHVLAYSARLAMELNADAVKVKYTGDPESFKWVVKNAGKTRVFVVGGPRTDTEYQLLKTAEDILAVGAAGFAIGRNIWQAKDPIRVADRLASVILPA